MVDFYNLRLFSVNTTCCLSATTFWNFEKSLPLNVVPIKIISTNNIENFFLDKFVVAVGQFIFTMIKMSSFFACPSHCGPFTFHFEFPRQNSELTLDFLKHKHYPNLIVVSVSFWRYAVPSPVFCHYIFRTEFTFFSYVFQISTPILRFSRSLLVGKLLPHWLAYSKSLIVWVDLPSNPITVCMSGYSDIKFISDVVKKIFEKIASKGRTNKPLHCFL